MSDLYETMEGLNSLIDESKQHIALADALKRLESNPDFIQVISNGYFTNLALNRVMRLGNPNCIDKFRDTVQEDLLGVSKLKYYFDSLYHNAEVAAKSIEDANRIIDEIESE